MTHGLTEWEGRELNKEWEAAQERKKRRAQLRIQALGAAISRKDWWAVDQAYNALRDAFDRPEVYDRDPIIAPVSEVTKPRE